MKTKKKNTKNIKDTIQVLDTFFNTPPTKSDVVLKSRIQDFIQVNGFNFSDMINVKDNLDNTVLLFAAMYGNIKLVKFLLEHGADPNCKDDLQKNALMYAVRKNSFDMIKSLIQFGVDVNAQDCWGFTALMLTDNVDVAGILIQAGAKVDIKDKDSEGGDTALNKAVISGNKDLIKLLIDNGADVNLPNFWKYTPVMNAVIRNDKSLVQMLIDCGAKLNVFNLDYQTPLMIAAERNKIDMIKLLLKNGADINFQIDDTGFTVLMDTIINMELHGTHVDVVKFLIQAGAKLNIKDNNKKTAYDYAKETDVLVWQNVFYTQQNILKRYPELVSLLDPNKTK